MQPSPPLTQVSIRNTLATVWMGQCIQLCDSLPSTNHEAVRLAHAAGVHGTVVIADTQTLGRGRLSRTWFSPGGANLYCSCILRIPRLAERHTAWLSWLPLISAIAASKAIEAVSSLHVSVKWPNDLLIGDRKVGGILCESGMGVATAPFQIIGIGLNVNIEPADWPPELRESATSIWQEQHQIVNRNYLLAQLLLELERCIDEFAQHGSTSLATVYRQRCSTIGYPVHATLANGDSCLGVAEDVGQDGSLHVRPYPIPGGGGTPKILQLHVADILHVRR